MSFFSQPVPPLVIARSDSDAAKRRRDAAARNRKAMAARAKWTCEQIEEEEQRLAEEIAARVEAGKITRYAPADESRRMN
ncbi:hypothetical protein B6V74_12885 [Thioclava sp. F42-5]|nr:hypothetical protein B6V74_12885 [Thioclava sp. F42-5]